MRLLRLLKMLKLLRLMRVVRLFRELRMMLMPIVQSMRTLFWAACLLAIVLYFFAIVFLQATAKAIVDDAQQTDAYARLDTSTLDSLRRNWGSVPLAMDSLFKAITGGTEWENLANPLSSLGVWYYLLFISYMAFLSLAVLNVLTGSVDTQCSLV